MNFLVTKPKFGFKVFLLVSLCYLLFWVNEAKALTQVRALIYSSTAAELQWNRSGTERVQISYNGEVMGLFDANSWYTDSLNPAVNHRFTIEVIGDAANHNGQFEVVFSTADFQPPVREITAQRLTTVTSQSEPNLANVFGLLYSSTALEVFWEKGDTQTVTVYLNGQKMGDYDSQSVFIENLDPGTAHTVRLLTSESNSSTFSETAYELVFDNSDFSGAVQSVAAVELTNTQSNPNSSDGSEQGSNPPKEFDNSTPAPAPAPAPPPPPEPEPEPEPTPSQQQPSDDQASPTTIQQPISSGDCVVETINDLIGCVNAADGFNRINIQSNLACSGAGCCPAGGALLQFNATQQLTIEGNGYRLLRTAGQRQCSLLDITNSNTIAINNWQLDDDQRVAPCVVSDNCPRMLHIRNSSNISLNGVAVSHGKGYVIYVQQVNGFDFVNSRLENSGVLGLYIGHTEQASTNVRIQNSTFLDNQTNALALLGVVGSSANTNLVANNVFRRNHWRGQWAVEPRFGTGFTGGGQVYLAQVSGLTVRDNIISDGFCENCFIQQRFGTGVSGIEIAIPRQNSVSNVQITGNLITNHDAWGIFVNQGSSVDSSVIVTGNTLNDNTQGLNVNGGTVTNNSVRDR